MNLPTGLGEYTDDELTAEIQDRGYHVSARKFKPKSEPDEIETLDLAVEAALEEISLCQSCFCMTHTIFGLCGKCKAPKPSHRV